jgi:predicted GNAT superfamily acetyltransferase
MVIKKEMMSIEYRCFEGAPTGETLEWLVNINQEVFGFNERAEHLAHLFQNSQHVLVCMAFQEEEPVGFKVGFQEHQHPYYFESWRGGVLEKARRQGIAMELMRLQHSWCKEKRFKVIKTTTNSNNVPMLITNLRSGFEIVGTFLHRQTKLKVLQEKRLD